MSVDEADALVTRQTLAVRSASPPEAPMLVALPPLAEQARIVAKVDHLMALCDSLEAKIRAADEGARRLAESLVAELIA